MDNIVEELERQILQHQKNLLRYTAAMAEQQTGAGEFNTKENRQLKDLENNLRIFQMRISELEEFNRKLIRTYVLSGDGELNRDIVLYGAGKYGLSWGAELQRYNIPVSAYVDSNPDNWGKYVNGVKVISLSDVLKQKKDVLWLISVANLNAKKEISNNLQLEGYQDIAYSVMEVLEILSEQRQLSKKR